MTTARAALVPATNLEEKLKTRHYPVLLLLVVLAVLVWSAINPHDFFTWFLEVLPVLLGVIVLAASYKRFTFTNFVYTLFCLHAIILMVGGHYTYAEVPPFNWMRDAFDLDRNYYDRVGHFAQGFFPAIVAREILLRLSPLKPGKWLFFLIACVCLALSAFYELIEWWMALAAGESAEAFLGTQGDVWDTQWDMLLALIGSLLAQFLFAKYHDKALANEGLAPA